MIRLFYNNLVDASGVVITKSSESSTLPAANVIDDQMTKVWRTGTSTAAEYVSFDLGASTAATAAIIHAHTILVGDSAIIVKGSTDNFSASNVTVATFAWSAGTMLITFNSVAYRYWRIAFTKASSGVTRDIGRIFIGTYTSIDELPDYDGWEEAKDERSETLTTAAGQTYSELRTSGRRATARISKMAQAD